MEKSKGWRGEGWLPRRGSLPRRPPPAPFKRPSRPLLIRCWRHCALSAPHVVQVVEDGYEFFARRQLVTLFSAPNYCGEFDNAGAMMSVDETLMCSFQVPLLR